MLVGKWRIIPKEGKNLRPMGFSPHGLLMLQTWEQVGIYLRTIDRYEVDLFVEIGIADGGLLMFIEPRTRIVPGFHYLGCELEEDALDDLPKGVHSGRLRIYVGDCFGAGFSTVLRACLEKSKKALILCDGGNKPKEVAYFRGMMRQGDLLIAHDFTDEIHEKDLDCLKEKWEEVEPELYRKNLIPMFRKVAP